MNKDEVIIHNKVDQIPPEEAKAILSGIVAIRQEADQYNYEAARETGKYFTSAAEKFGYDAWHYLIKNKAIVLAKQQESLPI